MYSHHNIGEHTKTTKSGPGKRNATFLLNSFQYSGVEHVVDMFGFPFCVILNTAGWR